MKTTLIEATEGKQVSWLSQLQNSTNSDAMLATYSVSLALYTRTELHERINSKVELLDSIAKDGINNSNN